MLAISNALAWAFLATAVYFGGLAAYPLFELQNTVRLNSPGITRPVGSAKILRHGLSRQAGRIFLHIKYSYTVKNPAGDNVQVISTHYTDPGETISARLGNEHEVEQISSLYDEYAPGKTVTLYSRPTGYRGMQRSYQLMPPTLSGKAPSLLNLTAENRRDLWFAGIFFTLALMFASLGMILRPQLASESHSDQR